MSKIRTSPIMDSLLENQHKRFRILQGSSGSAKTYTILQYLIHKCLVEWENKTIDITRRTFPALKRSTMKDFFDILMKLELYDPSSHNKSDNHYYLGSNVIRFYSAEDEQKLRGLRRDILYINEILEFKKLDVDQMLMRTHESVFADYNPSAEFHWVYEEFVDIEREDVFFMQCNFADHNPFLPKPTADQIRRYYYTDPNLWRIYGLGERGVPEATIFPNWDFLEQDFEKQEGQTTFGLDFGYNHPSALVKVKYDGLNISAKELLYKGELTGDLLVRELNKLKESGELDENSTIYADSSRPELITHIKNEGFNIHPAIKDKGSVLRGIDFIKKNHLLIDKHSENLAKELRTYKWKSDKDDNLLDEPIDQFDHLLDALRYALCQNSSQKPEIGIGSVSIE